MEQTRILVLAANPHNTARLRLDEEHRKIEEVLRQARLRDRFEIKHSPAARDEDIQQMMLDFKPHIVHFCGHGESDGIAFADENGQAHWVSGEALAGLFKLCSEHLQCVVLNACYSEKQARIISRHIATVAGMKKDIGDKAAIKFATGFYRALGSGKSLASAYEYGCSAIQLAGIPEHLTPVLIQNAPAVPFGGQAEQAAEVYVSGCQTDIFISYAGVDNHPFPGLDKGWVSALVDRLKIHLNQKLGGKNAYTLWMDLPADVSAETAAKLESTAIFLLILSPAYLASAYCRAQLQLFAADNRLNKKIFVVEQGAVEDDKYPEEIKKLFSYPFWIKDSAGDFRTLGLPKPNPDKDTDYYQKLDDLARGLIAALQALKTEKREQAAPKQASPEKTEETDATVFLARVTEDLTEQRNRLNRYFDQHKIKVLPEKTYNFAAIQEELDADLRQSQLFVQLLSDKTGDGYPCFQHQRARAAELPVLQWRNPDSHFAEITDPEHSALLKGETVIAVPLSEFQNRIVSKLFEPAAGAGNILLQDELLVFINASPEDTPFARQIEDFLDQHGIDCSLSSDTAALKPGEIRQYLKQNLLHCDAIIVPCEQTSALKIKKRLLHCHSVTAQRSENPVKVIAVCHNRQSAEQAALDNLLPTVKILDCAVLHSQTCLPLFIQMLQP
ncbi:MAG: TIR domain-containing protein [Gammaproteobacteria bacterium]|nr:TIR domain-containing protein [Gammaproteobacteria bacterium]